MSVLHVQAREHEQTILKVSVRVTGRTKPGKSHTRLKVLFCVVWDEYTVTEHVMWHMSVF